MRKALIAAAICALASRQAWGQVSQAIALEIGWENCVSYVDDLTDPTRRATSPGMVSARVSPARTFNPSMTIADIVSVNGQPAKGFLVIRLNTLSMTPNAASGGAIGDRGNGAVGTVDMEILQADGTPVGSIMSQGIILGAAPPGAPRTGLTHNMTISGGTGAFLGARGMLTSPATAVGCRYASMEEAPANRRTHGGDRGRFIAYLIPAIRPEILSNGGAPAVVHASDFTLVSASRPAAPGEILSLYATGLGPTRPGLELGSPFRSQPLHEVNSPLEVFVNGRAAEVLAAVGNPGSVDAYQVNFRVPGDTPPGMATLQVSAAWVTGAEVRIAVR